MKDCTRSKSAAITKPAASFSEEDLLDQLASARVRLASGDPQSQQVKAWTNPMIGIQMMELHFKTLDLIEKLQADLRQIQGQNQALLDALADHGVFVVPRLENEQQHIQLAWKNAQPCPPDQPRPSGKQSHLRLVR